MEKLSEDLRITREKRKALEAEESELQSQVVSILEEAEQKSFRYSTDDGATVTVTRVQVEKLVIDEAGLRKEVGSKMWPKISKRVLDEDKLTDRIASGEIADTDVAKHSSTVKNRPFVRFARRGK